MDDILFAYRASLALVQLTAKTFFHQQVQTVFQSVQTDGVNNLVDKSEHQQQACFTCRDSTLLHIEQGTLVELPHRSAMTALHIIRLVFQLRLGVHVRVTGGAQIPVGLL